MPKEEKAPELGKWVKRSTYQVVCEENKKLKADIYALVMRDDNFDAFARWHKKFTDNAEFAAMMRQLLNIHK